MKVVVFGDSRYRIKRSFVRKYVTQQWEERGLAEGVVHITFVGSRKARELSQKHLHDDAPHPVITVPYGVNAAFPHDGSALADIIICFPQVVLFSAQQNKTVDTVVKQFIDHALTILSQKWRNV